MATRSGGVSARLCGFLAGLALALSVAMSAAVAVIAARDASAVGRLERQSCAWRFFEDGSTVTLRDDAKRYACLRRTR